MPDTPAATATTSRMTFDQEVIENAKNFAVHLFQLVPELEGLAILPSWKVPQPHLPYGVVMGRSGPLQTPVEVMHMAIQLHGAMKHQLDGLIGIMGHINGQAGDLQRMLGSLQDEIDQKRAQLHDLDTRIASHTGNPPAPVG